MSSTDRPNLLKRPWQFYVGAACVVISFFTIVTHYTNIFHPILFESESELDIATIRNGIQEGMTFALWCLPVMLIGFVFLGIASARKP